MSTTVLLLGGPKDGELLAVEHPLNGIRAIEYADDTEALFAWGQTDPVATVETRIRYYTVQRVAMFGHVLVVMVMDGLTEDDIAERAFAHLASDKAKEVVLR